MRTVECKLDENEFRAVTAEAKRLGVYRSELIRSRVTGTQSATPTPSARTPTCAEYLTIINTVRQRMGNAISPSHVEQCVAITLRCMHG